MEVHEPHYGVTGGTPAAPGAGSVSVSGTLQSWSEQVQVGTECVLWWEGNCQDWGPVYETVYYSDGGTVTVTVNGAAKAVEYGSGSTATTIATALRTAINADSAYPATAGGTGTSVTLTSKLAGAASNYALTTGVTWDTGHFGSASFTATRSGPTLTGGTDASGGTPGSCCSLDTPAVTLYTYDTLDNLTFVSQSGSRPRSFAYNSLSQLLSATNPESGAITYTYDNAGNVLTKIDARSITTTFTYDALNRLTQKSYSDSTPTVKYGYDGVAPSGCTITLTAANPTGRRTAMCDAAGTEAWSFDAMGRVTTARRKIDTVTKDFGYQYYETGAVWKLTYPTGSVIEYKATSGGLTEYAKDLTNNINYALGAGYTPGGTLAAVTLGQTATFGGIFLNQSFNPRGQPITINAWSTNGVALDLGYTFADPTTGANNGNVLKITNNLNTARTQNFTYDQLNRIHKAWTQATSGSNCWGIEHGYDIWANLLWISQLGTHQCTSGILSVGVTSQNRLSNSGVSYDAAGNMLSDGPSSYTWDGASRIKTAAGVTYTYDGDAKRLKKSNGRLYWYGMETDALVETDALGNNPDEYVFFNERRIARRKSNGTIHFYFADHLGTSRIVTNATGAVLDDSDFYPFGGERVITSSSGNTYKFTGKERDAESGLDYFGARYHSSSYGRFSSPDWEEDPVPIPHADLTNPQTLNLYAYAQGNPLVFVDPNGHSGKHYQLTGKYTARPDSGIEGESPNVHVFKSGKEVARGQVNPDGTITWDKPKAIGQHIKDLAKSLSDRKNFPALAAERQQANATRNAARAATHGVRGGRLAGGMRVLGPISIIVGVLADVAEMKRSREEEPETGWHYDGFRTVVTDIKKAGQSLPVGSEGTLDGQTFTLGEDGLWRNKYGHTLCQVGRTIMVCGSMA